MVDFRLPSDSELFAAANPNPQTEAARLTATGSPEQVRAIGHRLQRSGVELDAVHSQSQRVQQALGGAFANGGHPVYDEQAHRELMPAGLADAGTRLHDAGRRVGGSPWSCPRPSARSTGR